jgi:ACT domain-containing protein
MVLELQANLPDNPGTLIQLLKPISDNAGNILTVVHSREKKRGEKVPVTVHFDLPGNNIEERMKNITTELSQHNIEILKVTEIVQTEIINIIMLGHVFETDFVDTFKRISKTGAKVVRIEALFTDLKDISNVKFEIHVNKQFIKNMMEEIEAICQEKNLNLISEVA